MAFGPAPRQGRHRRDQRRRELSFLTGVNDPAQVKDICGTTAPKLMVVTSGHAGSIHITSDFMGLVPASMSKRSDTTGAGDAFTAGLLAGLL
ncbi:MAG: hypothetical protein IPM60_17670 [Rhodospirillales bacterium]|nr:hypothetical protein [Rhodospirillales bacterium]